MCYKCKYCGDLFQDRAITIRHQDYCKNNPESLKKMQDLFGTVWVIGQIEDNEFYHVTDIDDKSYKLYESDCFPGYSYCVLQKCKP